MKKKSKVLNAGGSTLDSGVRTAGLIGRWALRLWHLLVHNRLAIAVASLLWLIFRSGSQPRRITYPCQQVAAVNVGAFAAGLVPALFLARKGRRPHGLPRAVVVRRQLLIAGIMFVAALIGVEGYQFAGSLIPPELPDVPPRLGDPIPTTVGICQQDPQGGSYTTAQIETMVRQAVTLAGGLDDIVSPGDTVVIKPNLVQPKWDASRGVVTNPRVCAAIVKIAKEAGAAQVIIAEGTADRAGTGGMTWYAFNRAGYDTNWDHWFDYDTSVQLFDLNDTGGPDQYDPAKVTSKTISNGVIRSQYWIPNIILNCDVLISVPTFKNHGQGTVTLSMKNRVGCAPNDIYHAPWSTDEMKWALMHDTSSSSGFPWTIPPAPADENELVQRTLVDLNLVRPQDFAVVEALIGVTNGPVDDPPSPPNPWMRMIVAGRDSVAVDTVGALAMGYDPDYITQIAWADGTGALGTKDTRYITVLGDHVAWVRNDFPHRGGSVRANSSPPWIGNISLTEGQEVTGTVTITGSGIGDDRGVVKAELAVDGNFLATNPDWPYADFEWDSTTVPEGPHSVTVTVYDAALNEASITRNVTVVYPLPIPGDFNGDRDVDQQDCAHLTGCMSGAGVPPAGGCTDADLEGDNDVDQTDFGLLQRCLTGPDVQGDPHCAD